MAAAYQTGTATSPTNLLQTLVTWLVAQGWTSNMSQVDGTGWRAHLSKSGLYINLRATAGGETIWVGGVGTTTGYNGIGIYAGTGFSGGSAWNTQAGGPIGSGQTYTVGAFMQTPSGAMTAYHFFDDGSDNIAVVVERTATIFTHMGWGPSLVKAGSWTGGAYFFSVWTPYWGYYTSGGNGTPTTTANCPGCHNDGVLNSNACFVRADVDAFTSKWIGISSANTAAQGGYTGKNGGSSIMGFPSAGALPVEIPQYGTTFQGRITSVLNGQANLLPVRLYAARDGGGYSLIGDLPSIFYSNGVGNGFSASSIYPLGSDNYMMFPNFAVMKKA